MLTRVDSSPVSSSPTAQSTTCSSPDAGCSNEQRVSPTSPTPRHQDLASMSCAKRPSSQVKYTNRHRTMPYPEGAAISRSPGSCSSDGDSVPSDAEGDGGVRVHGKVKRIAANSRERKRMHTVNSAFDQLRELVPTYPSNRKLSKIDTLRLACTYIQDLVSLLHNTQTIQGEDVLYQQPFTDSSLCINNGYTEPIKQEVPNDFTSFAPQGQQFSVPTCLRFPTDCTDSYQNCTPESDTTVQSPPQQFMACPPPPPPPSSRPPPLTRVSSEGTSSIHTQMAEATISGHHPSMSLSQPPPPPPPPQQQSVQPPPPQLPVSTSMYQRQVNITSPLAMHSVQHTSVAPSLLQGHHPLSPVPVWQRASSAGYALYGQ